MPATVIPKVKGTCENCLTEFDNSCGDTDCDDVNIEYSRMAGACGCTCNEMAWEICPTYQEVLNCPCQDGIPRTGLIIDGAWIGFSVPSENLNDLADQTCNGNTEVAYFLYGSTELLNCVTDTTGLTPIVWDGSLEQVDLVATPVEREDGICVGGLFFLDAGALGISLDDPAEGETVSCTQSGGYQTLVVEINDRCGNRLALCPFAGILGGAFECGEPADFCCLLNLMEEIIPCDGTTSFINYTYEWSAGCACMPDATVTIDGQVYALTDPPSPISHELTPCELGVTTVTVTLDITYPSVPDCEFDCTDHNGSSSHDVTV